MKPTDVEMSPLMGNRIVYWLDVQYGDKYWRPLFTYSSLKDARIMRDHFNGKKNQKDYPIYIDGITGARVRIVKVEVEIEL